MSIDEITEACNYNIAKGGNVVLLVLPGPPPKRGYYMRLCKTRGPLGEIICTKPSGESVVRFSAKAVLKFIEQENTKHPQPAAESAD